ncbi:hypothetical protein BJ165DRAFT_122440 [Panaeolus papilionaceus]|nr:hypothetical protein BJ165DRAFT_122440 [Panaeolus papilionaceus]
MLEIRKALYFEHILLSAYPRSPCRGPYRCRGLRYGCHHTKPYSTLCKPRGL